MGMATLTAQGERWDYQMAHLVPEAGYLVTPEGLDVLAFTCGVSTLVVVIIPMNFTNSNKH